MYMKKYDLSTFLAKIISLVTYFFFSKINLTVEGS